MNGRGWKGWIRPSTREFAREARQTKGYTLFDWIHGYVYARWPYLYIGIGTGEHRLAKALGWISRRLPHQQSNRRRTGLPAETAGEGKPAKPSFADTYHGKVVPLQAAAQLVTVREEIRIENLEKIIPYTKARDLILKNPDHIAVLDCPCRTVRPDPCLPLDVCLIVGEPFASFVTEHHPKRARWITSEEAVEILRAEDARGHVHHAFFKDAMLGRFYAICNCCACCCGAMQAQRHGTPMLASSGYIVQLDEELCIGCGACEETCQFGALTLGEIHSEIDQEKCMGCGVCVSQCEQGALALVREPSKGEPLEIFGLMEDAKHVRAA